MKNKWIKRFKSFLITVIILTVIYFGGSYTLDRLFGDMCGNEIVEKVVSPNGENVAFIFQRDCGATTGISFQLSLFDAEKKLPNKGGNVFVSDKSFQVKWVNNKKLQVNYQKSSETFEMDKRVGWTRIEYVGE